MHGGECGMDIILFGQIGEKCRVGVLGSHFIYDTILTFFQSPQEVPLFADDLKYICPDDVTSNAA